MIYQVENELILRTICEEDASKFSQAFKEQGWNKPEEQFLAYVKEQEEKKRITVVAELGGEVAGYTTLLPSALDGPFAAKKIPEICDFNVLMKFQKKGIGNKILDVAEIQARQFAKEVSLGVGLHVGYGAAQRIYIKRGYLPDGSGVWYHGHQLEPYADCNNDDDLVLYLSKKL